MWKVEFSVWRRSGGWVVLLIPNQSQSKHSQTTEYWCFCQNAKKTSQAPSGETDFTARKQRDGFKTRTRRASETSAPKWRDQNWTLGSNCKKWDESAQPGTKQGGAACYQKLLMDESQSSAWKLHVAVTLIQSTRPSRSFTLAGETLGRSQTCKSCNTTQDHPGPAGEFYHLRKWPTTIAKTFKGGSSHYVLLQSGP